VTPGTGTNSQPGDGGVTSKAANRDMQIALFGEA
jgi:hypothetical protein